MYLTAFAFELALGLLVLENTRLRRLSIRLGNGVVAVVRTRPDRRRTEELTFHGSDGLRHELLRLLLGRRRIVLVLRELGFQVVHGVAEFARNSWLRKGKKIKSKNPMSLGTGDERREGGWWFRF